jgi:hypothetical protein
MDAATDGTLGDNEPYAPAPLDERGASALDVTALLALQLAARGYTLAQIALLVGTRDARGVMALLRQAAEHFGAPDAVAEARRRGLIV